MSSRFVLALVATTLLTVGAAAQSAQQQPTQQTNAPNANQTVTITGCVTAGPNNTFTLTAASDAAAKEAPTGTTATTPAGSKVAKTITYTLNASKPDELKGHVGHTVQVTGVEAPPQQVAAATTDRSTGAANTQGTAGTAGGRKPTVETTSQTQLVVRQLTVNAVKMVSSGCSLVK
jgi:hypothetical protein